MSAARRVTDSESLPSNDDEQRTVYKDLSGNTHSAHRRKKRQSRKLETTLSGCQQQRIDASTYNAYVEEAEANTGYLQKANHLDTITSNGHDHSSTQRMTKDPPLSKSDGRNAPVMDKARRENKLTNGLHYVDPAFIRKTDGEMDFSVKCIAPNATPKNDSLQEKVLENDVQESGKKFKEVQGFGESFLKCELCLDEYNEQGRIPRILPCLHVVCHQCLEQRVREQTIMCPICRTNHLVSEGGIKQFPRDKTRRNIRDFVKLGSKNSKIPCRDCPDLASADFFCKDCFAFLCKECKTAHLRNFMSRRHLILAKDDICEAGVRPQQKPETCNVNGHEGNLLDYFCASKKCQVTACKMCIILQHDPKDGHAVRKLQAVYNDNSSTVSTLIRRLQEKISKTKTVKFATEDVLKDISHKEREIAVEIDRETDRAISILATRRATLKDILHLKCKEKKVVLDAQKEFLRHELMVMTDAKDFGRYCINYAMPTDFLCLLETLSTRLNELRSRKIELCPLDNSVLTFNKNAFEKDFELFVSNLGQVQSTSIYPMATRVDIRDVAVDIKSDVIKIMLCDVNGKQQTDDSMDCIEVNILDPHSKYVTPSSVLTRQENGQFIVTIITYELGEYTCSVKVFDTNIKEQGFYFLSRNAGEVDKWHGDIVCPGFTFDMETVHIDRSVSSDGNILTTDKSTTKVISVTGKHSSHNMRMANQMKGIDHENSNRRLQKYCGVLGTRAFGADNKYYFEAHVSYQINVHLVRNALVFEIGVGKQDSIYNSFYVGAQTHAWSFSAERCSEHNQICHKFRHKRVLLLHSPLSPDTAGTIISKRYGFLLDLKQHYWLVYECDKRKILYRFEDVECPDLTIWPVFGTYNPCSADVKIELVTGHSIASVPTFLT